MTSPSWPLLVVVVSEALWRQRLGARPDVIGQAIRLNGHPFTIVGVVPAAFTGAGIGRPLLWAPLIMQQQLRPRGLTLDTRGWGWLNMVGRLAAGASRPGAQAALDAAAAAIDRTAPSSRDPLAFAVRPAVLLPESQRRAVIPFLQIAGAFTGLLLIITCANLAGVMQARLVARRRELAIRQSLGAGRGHLLREWLCEALVLSAAGGLAGALIARGASLLVAGLSPLAPAAGAVPAGGPIEWRVLAFAAGVSLVAGLLFGLVPAVRAAAAQPIGLLKDEAGTTTGGRAGVRARRISVFVQVVGAAVLLLMAALLTESLRHIRAFDPGFPADRLVLSYLNIPGDASANHTFIPRLLERVRAVPGVAAADVTRSVPLEPGSDTLGFRIPGYVEPDGTTIIAIDDAIVGAEYFRTLDLQMLRGHGWGAAAEALHDVPRVAVINRTMAKRFWPGRDPVGTRIEAVGIGEVEIIGVVADSSYYEIGEPPRPFIYAPAESVSLPGFTLIARARGRAADVQAAMARAVGDVDPDVAASSVETFETMRQQVLSPNRLLGTATSVLGLLALALAAVGLYGVVSMSVGQRTREIGVRMALGARPVDVLRNVLGGAVGLVLAGALAGLLVGGAAASVLRRWLFAVTPFDPLVSGAVALLLVATAVAAAWIPARRAARVDPVKALR